LAQPADSSSWLVHGYIIWPTGILWNT